MEVSNEDKTNIELMYKILMIRVSTVIKTNLLQQVDELMASKVNRNSPPRIPISISDDEYEPTADLKNLKLDDFEFVKQNSKNKDSPKKSENDVSINEEDLKISPISINKTRLESLNVNDSLEATIEDTVHVDPSGQVIIRRYKTIKSPNINQQRKEVKTPQSKASPFLLHDPNVRRNSIINPKVKNSEIGINQFTKYDKIWCFKK
jgi:hypothetical protein